MAVMIDCDGKMILHVRSSTFEMLYQNIVNKQVENDIIFPSNVQTLIDYLCNACSGVGDDIADYLKTRAEVLYFAQLIKDAIEESEKQYPMLTEETKKRIWNFYHEIVVYAETLKIS